MTDEIGSIVTTVVVAGAALAGMIAYANASSSSQKRRDEEKQKAIALRESIAEDIAAGKELNIDRSNIILQVGETMIWREPGDLYEERVVSRKWEGGSKGISIPTGILDTKIHLGRTKGSLNVQRGHVPIATGSLVITTKHLIFSGDTKSVKTPLAKLIDVQVGNNGIIAGIDGRQKPLMVVFKDPIAGPIIAAALTRATGGAS